MNYFEPPTNAKVFTEEDDAWKYAQKLESEMSICEGGVQRLSQIEIIDGLREELEMLRNPAYCPECGACGQDGCCSGSKCSYGGYYAKEYDYYKSMADELYEEFPDKVKLEEIFKRNQEKYYAK